MGGLTAALLLLPIPAYALTFGTWTLTNPGGGAPNWWLNSTGSTTAPAGPSFDILITGSSAKGIAPTYTITGSVTTGPGQTSLNAVLSNFDSLSSVTGPSGKKVTVNVKLLEVKSPIINDQFSGEIKISTLTGQAVTITPGTTYNVSITFSFDNNSQWTTVSPHRITADIFVP